MCIKMQQNSTVLQVQPNVTSGVVDKELSFVKQYIVTQKRTCPVPKKNQELFTFQNLICCRGHEQHTMRWRSAIQHKPSTWWRTQAAMGSHWCFSVAMLG